MSTEPQALLLTNEPLISDDPIPKVFAYFCEAAGKSPQYRLTKKRYDMAKRRWNEESKVERSRRTPAEKIRSIVGNRFKNVIDEICSCEFHRKNGYLDWEQLFGSEDRFNKWVDRYENGYAEHQTELAKARHA